MTTTPASPEDRTTFSPPAARSPEDILALIPSVLGFWPRESLVIIACSADAIGPCIRLDLPASLDGIEEWSEALDPVIRTLTAHRSMTRAFTAVFTQHTRSLDDVPEVPAEVGDGTDFLCSTIALLASTTAMGRAGGAGLEPQEMWVLDRANDRWGWLHTGRSEPGRDELAFVRAPIGDDVDVLTPCWLVEGGGTVENVLGSPLGVALAVNGRSAAGASSNPMDQSTLPGHFELAGVVGASRASAFRRSLRRAVAERGSDPLDLGPDAEVLDRLVDRVAAAHRERWQHSKDAPPAEELLELVTIPELAELARGLHRSAWLYESLVCTALGLEELRAFTRAADRRTEDARQRVATDGARDAGADRARNAGTALLLGRGERQPVKSRVCALRFLLTLIEQSVKEPVASGAAVANAYLSWFCGMNSQAAAYLHRVGSNEVIHLVALLKTTISANPLPEWLGMRPMRDE